MNFEKALKAMRDGKKVKRKDEVGYLHIREILCHEADCDQEEIKTECILANDWEIVE